VPLELNPNFEPKSIQAYQNEIADLRYQLQVAEDTLEAIRTGSVDALAIQDNGITKIFTLEGAEQTYRVLVENMSEGAITLNQEGLILYANAQFAQLVHLPLNEVIGTPFSRYISREYLSLFEQVFTQGWQQHTKKEFILQPLPGAAVHVYISLTTIESKGDKVLGLIITNLSEQKELERLTQAKEELFENNQALLRTNNDLDTFVYTASHDLKSPIINIEGLMGVLEEMLQEGDSLVDIKAVITRITSSINRFKNIILNLTEIAKVQKNFSSQADIINCHEIIEDVKADLKEAILQSQTKVFVHLSDCQELQFSKKNFQSIVYNLVSNAIKYGSPERSPTVIITMEKWPDYVLPSVQDNGLGIDLKYKEKLFAMFERLHNHVEGSGIGLYIVKRIIDNAGGKIDVESELGKGSTFKVYFPRY